MKSIPLRTLAITGIIGSLLAVTACGSQTTPSPNAGTPSATATIEPAPVASGPVAKDGTPLTGTHGLKVKGLAENENGQYLQITISDDDPALVYNADIVTPDITAKFAAEEIADAQKFAMTFLVEEGFDSTVNDGTNYDEWMAREASNFNPVLFDALRAALVEQKDFINLRGWGLDHTGYTYHYDKDSTRILSYSITPTGVSASSNPNNPEAIVFNYTYELSTVQKNLENEIYPVTTKGNGRIGVRKDPASAGKWLISEMYTNYESFSADEYLNP